MTGDNRGKATPIFSARCLAEKSLKNGEIPLSRPRALVDRTRVFSRLARRFSLSSARFCRSCTSVAPATEVAPRKTQRRFAASIYARCLHARRGPLSFFSPGKKLSRVSRRCERNGAGELKGSHVGRPFRRGDFGEEIAEKKRRETLPRDILPRRGESGRKRGKQ